MQIVTVGAAFGLAWETAVAIGRKYFPSEHAITRAYRHYVIRTDDVKILIIELRSFFVVANIISQTSGGNFNWQFLDATSEYNKADSSTEKTNYSGLLWPIYDESVIALFYDKFSEYVVGGDKVSETLFINPILSPYGESLVWLRSLAHYNYVNERRWFILQYRLFGYEDGYHPLGRTKILIEEDGVVLEDTDWAARLFPIYRSKLFGGDTYKRLQFVDEDGETDEKIFCYSHEYEYNGTLYEVVENDEETETPTIGLDPLYASQAGGTLDIVGLAPDCRRVNKCLDIFSSPEADHYYLIKQTADNVIYNDAYPNAIMPRDPGYIVLFSGCNLTVEKRKKTDWSLVTTYNVTPTGLDWEQQGNTVAQQVMCIENSSSNYGIPPATNNNSVSRMFAVCGGIVLVTTLTDGEVTTKTEYPLLPVVNCLQDYLELYTGINIADKITSYRDGELGTENLRRNLYHQTALIWLGGESEGAYTWDGVDGCAVPLEGDKIGVMRDWRKCISDSQSGLLLANPHNGQFLNVFFSDTQADRKTANLTIYLPDLIYCYLNTLTLAEEQYNFEYVITLDGSEHIFSATDNLESDDIDEAEILFLEFLNSIGFVASVLTPHDGSGYTVYTVQTEVAMSADIFYRAVEYGASSASKLINVVIEDDKPVMRKISEASFDIVDIFDV